MSSQQIARAPMVAVALGCIGPSLPCGAMRYEPTTRLVQMTPPPIPQIAPLAAAVAAAYR